MILDKTLIAMEQVQEILETAFFTAPLSGTIPTSIMLIGPPGTGKSKAILQFNAPSIHVTNDITSAGLCELLDDDKLGTLRHLVIPDFNIVVNHRQSTTNLTVATLLTIMAEGIARVDDGRRKKEIKHAPIGIISAMTRDVFEETAKKFHQLGIARRFAYLFFNYSFQTRDKIQTEISNGAVTLQQLLPKKLDLPKAENWPLTILIHENESRSIKEISREMAENMSFVPRWTKEDNSWVIRPFRGPSPIEFTPHMLLRTMAQGHALLHKRYEVSSDDLQFLIRFVSFTNYSAPTQL